MADALAPLHLEALSDPAAYSHPVQQISMIETHISWVFLTGDFAYKLKKPVAFDFVDFSTLERRLHFCHEEVRCNQQFAPELYLGVVPITHNQSKDCYQVGGEGDIVDYAVRMVQFDTDQQLDLLVEKDQVSNEEFYQFGRTLADQHNALPTVAALNRNIILEHQIDEPVLANFSSVRNTQVVPTYRSRLHDLEQQTRKATADHRTLFMHRLQHNHTRECHGDLHLSNLVRTSQGIRAFDCLEFNEDLRWIDTMCDVAFLLMDCGSRDRLNLGYAFVDGYLDTAADYSGARLLPYYAAYRAMVRVKVSALRLAQNPGAQTEALTQRIEAHLFGAETWLNKPTGKLIVMCGVSGSGKSYLAERLVPLLPAIRLRSDVLRKHLAGLAADAQSGSDLNQGLYAVDRSAAVYQRLGDLAADLLDAGENVIIDATCLERPTRERFAAIANERGTKAMLVFCTAQQSILEDRVNQRQAAGTDPSEADVRVLRAQLEHFEQPLPSEGTVIVNTGITLDPATIAAKLC
ncbi:MAG: AAA family ATPase [Proteobacteria bacterium]|nr:AAA family ATPase [Pseudomonadota bacterium]